MVLPLDSVYSHREFADKLLRIKIGATDDPDWAALQLHPDSIEVAYTGVIADGNYRVTVTPVSPDVTLPGATTTTRTLGVPATFALLATQQAVDLAADADLSPYLERAVAVGDNVYFTAKSSAPRFSLAANVPGGVVATVSPSGTFPMMATTSNQRGMRGMQPDALALAFVSMDGSGNVLPDDNACQFDIQMVRLVVRVFPEDSPNGPPRIEAVTGSATDVGHIMHDEYRVPFHGGRFGVRMTNIVNTPTGHVHFEVYWRELIT